MTYDYRAKKTVLVLASHLEPGVALNVAGHLSVALGAHGDDGDLMGRDVLKDASGVPHTGISRYPVIVTKVKQNRLRRLVAEARERDDVFWADYPEQMLTTGHDDELADAVAGTAEEDIAYLGVMVYGPLDAVTALTGRFSLWQ
ncbi:DUF2000 domain-containing protein [Streptomyces griseoviridis]